MYKKIQFVVVFILLTIAFVGAGHYVGANGGRNGECEDATYGSQAQSNSNPRVYTAPNGQIITGVCIKSGANMFGDGHSDALSNGTYENGCYTVTGVGTSTVTITKNFGGNSCQDISHLDIYVQTQTTPTSTPSATPTMSATPTSTPEDEDDDPTPTPTATASATPQSSSTPTASPTTSPSATPTSTPGTGGNSNNDDNSSSNNSSSTSNSGQVLAASTMATTGVFNEIISVAMMLVGFITSTASVYASRKNN